MKDEGCALNKLEPYNTSLSIMQIWAKILEDWFLKKTKMEIIMKLYKWDKKEFQTYAIWSTKHQTPFS